MMGACIRGMNDRVRARQKELKAEIERFGYLGSCQTRKLSMARSTKPKYQKGGLYCSSRGSAFDHRLKAALKRLVNSRIVGSNVGENSVEVFERLFGVDHSHAGGCFSKTRLT